MEEGSKVKKVRKQVRDMEANKNGAQVLFENKNK